MRPRPLEPSVVPARDAGCRRGARRTRDAKTFPGARTCAVRDAAGGGARTGDPARKQAGRAIPTGSPMVSLCTLVAKQAELNQAPPRKPPAGLRAGAPRGVGRARSPPREQPGLSGQGRGSERPRGKGKRGWPSRGDGPQGRRGRRGPDSCRASPGRPELPAGRSSQDPGRFQGLWGNYPIPSIDSTSYFKRDGFVWFCPRNIASLSRACVSPFPKI